MNPDYDKDLKRVEGIINHLVGHVMRETNGRANAAVAKRIIIKKLYPEYFNEK